MEDQGRCHWHFPCPFGPQEACWASGSGLLPSGGPSGCVGPRGIGGRIRVNTPSISPAHSDPGHLLGSSKLQGQRHSWAPPAVLSLRPSPQPRSFLAFVFLLFFGIVVVLPSGCCFIYIFIIFIFSKISVSFLTLFYVLLFVNIQLLFVFFGFFLQSHAAAGSWFMSQGWA